MASKRNRTVDLGRTYRKKSKFADVFGRMKKNRGAMIGLVIISLMILLAILAPLIFDYKTVVIKQNIPDSLQTPSWKHWLGTDDLGRDLLARIVYGSRNSLGIGFASVAIALVLGGILGAAAGYFGRMVDMIIMRIMDVFLAIPATLFAMAIVAALGSSTRNLIIALTISAVPSFARIVRGAVLTVRDKEYVEAARAIGLTQGMIIFEHVVPNSLAPIIVQTTLQVASTILITAGLSFVGLGIQAPMPEWGALLSSGRALIREYSYLSLFPGMAIMLSILSLNLLGDGLRDALDPRLR